MKTATGSDQLHLDLLQQWNGADVFSVNNNVICTNVLSSFLWS